MGVNFFETFRQPIQDISGYFGGDWLHAKREQNRDRLKKRKEEILTERNVTERVSVSPAIGVPLLLAAQDESRDELREIWAHLLAAVEDPTREKNVRIEFIDTVKRMNPIDALVLRALLEPDEKRPNVQAFIATKLGLPEIQVSVSRSNLIRLECAALTPTGSITTFFITDYGRLLLAVCTG